MYSAFVNCLTFDVVVAADAVINVVTNLMIAALIVNVAAADCLRS